MKWCQAIFCLIFLKFSVSSTQGQGGFLEDFFQKFPHLPFAQVASVQDPSSVFEDLIQKRVQKSPSRAPAVKRQLFYGSTTSPKPKPAVITTTTHSMFL